MDPDSISIILVVFLFIASAYFALTETAISSVSKNRIKTAAEKGDARAKRVLYVLDHFDDAVTTLLICTNIAHIAAASIVTVLVSRSWGLGAITISTVVTTIAMFFVGEMLPKSIGKKANVKASLTCSGLLVALMKLCRPLSRILTGIGNLFSKMGNPEEEKTVTEDELYDIIEDMEEEGSIDEEQSDLISSTLQFADVTVNSVLTPRVDIVGVDVSEEPEKILEFIRNQNHSRIVVMEGDTDHIIGVLQIRKYLKAYVQTKELPDIRSLMDEVYYAHQSTPVDELLEAMSRNKLNMAVVTDSFGGTLGIVTVEDIIEEIVGEIWDEDDVIAEPIVELSDRVYLVNGDETVNDTFDFMEWEDPEAAENEERFTNLLMADWVYEQFPLIPKKGESFRYHDLTVRVEEIDRNRILKIRVELDRQAKEEVEK